MNRRGFLNILGLTPVAVVADKQGWWQWFKQWIDERLHSDQYVFSDWVTPEALSSLTMSIEDYANTYCDRDYAAEFSKDFSVGRTVTIELPSSFKTSKPIMLDMETHSDA